MLQQSGSAPQELISEVTSSLTLPLVELACKHGLPLAVDLLKEAHLKMPLLDDGVQEQLLARHFEYALSIRGQSTVSELTQSLAKVPVDG